MNVLDKKITGEAESFEVETSCMGEFVNVVVSIAAALGENGHKQLIKATLTWINKWYVHLHVICRVRFSVNCNLSVLEIANK